MLSNANYVGQLLSEMWEAQDSAAEHAGWPQAKKSLSNAPLQRVDVEGVTCIAGDRPSTSGP